MQTPWNLFIDDIRSVAFANRHDLEFEVARSFSEAVELCKKKNSLPSFISFDHDLGWDDETNTEAKSGYDFAKFLVDCILDQLYEYPDHLEWQVHSSNPPGKKNIEMLLKSFKKRYFEFYA